MAPATLRPLLTWFRRRARPLPWRRDRDPYRIWVSEVMLQQTRVETVIPYFERWMKRFPTVTALARAPRSRVMKAWEGLGYYARARNLHDAAKIVAKAGWPDDLRTLPGVGEYIAAALGSQAFGRPEPVVDGNVRRVVARLRALPEPRDAREWLETRIDRRAPGDFNQALMELGQTLCTPRSPRCGECPLRRSCEARRRGIVDRIPARKFRKATPHFVGAVGIVERGDRVLVARRRDDGLLGGLWEFPGGKRKRESLEECLRRELREETGIEVRGVRALTTVTHAYSHFRVTLYAFTAKWARGTARPHSSAEVRWVRRSALRRLAFPGASRKILSAYITRPAAAAGAR